MDINQGQKEKDTSFENQMKETFASTSLEQFQQEINYVNTEIWTNNGKETNTTTRDKSNSRG